MNAKRMEKRIENYPQKSFDHAVVAVDLVIFNVIKGKLMVLLLELKEDPFKGKWALPGGLVTQQESLEDAVKRHMKNRVGKIDAHFEQLYTFGDPQRDPRGWVVSVAYMALISSAEFEPKTTKRYKRIDWKSVGNLPPLAYDHEKIINTAVERLRNKVAYTNIIKELMPSEFTLTELQEMYELILGEKLDKRNFRKKILALEILDKLDKKKQGTPMRPAQLYRFKSDKLQEISLI